MTESPVTKEVIRDLRERNRLGWERYGRPLQPETYESNLQELYEELLDAVQYLKAELMLRKENK